MPIRSERHRLLLDSGRRTQGIFIKIPSTQVIDIVADSAFDFVIIDLEHSQLSESDALRLVGHALLVGVPAVVRIPVVDRGSVNRLLEAGALGIQLSTVRTVRQIRQLVAASRYPPDGSRSIGVAHPAMAYGARDLAAYLADSASKPPLVIAQIETAETEDPLEEILRAGADVAFVGTMDLRVDLKDDAEAVAARIGEIAVAAAGAGVRLGGANCDHADVSYAADHSDIGLFRVSCARTFDNSTVSKPRHSELSEVSPEDHLEIEQLLVEFAHRVDHDAGMEVEELFQPDGAYVIDGSILAGRAAIREGYAARTVSGPRTARHLLANLRTTRLDHHRVQAESILVVYAEDGEPVHRSAPPLVVGDFLDVCVRGADRRWRFERRELTTYFRGDGPVRAPATRPQSVNL